MCSNAASLLSSVSQLSLLPTSFIPLSSGSESPSSLTHISASGVVFMLLLCHPLEANRSLWWDVLDAEDKFKYRKIWKIIPTKSKQEFPNFYINMAMGTFNYLNITGRGASLLKRHCQMRRCQHPAASKTPQ